MKKNYLDIADFRYQAITTLAKDWRSPFTGILHKKGAILEFSAITKYSSNTKISFPIPNVSAMFLNLSYRLFRESQSEIVKVEKQKKDNQEVAHVGDISNFFDLLEKRLASVVFAYTALEVFANQTIPDKFVYQKKRSDEKCFEVYTKQQIERWVNLDEKLGDVLPIILAVVSPKNKKLWTEYKKLKELRDRLIHPKTRDFHSVGPDDQSILNVVTQKSMNNPAITGKNLIGYFVKAMKEKPRWFSKLPF